MGTGSNQLFQRFWPIQAQAWLFTKP
ncbi:hypothetical protein TorRG33x02_199770 [Trema orientale]|uniref:Uncharacterized protein n=1 Tax=Trema orientale TaxID=63057 RepID=A0A2P5EF99_TREOI|nr:hypothetical protein TorRG33x02_199770 [Trema orientale]